jgi:hypothetical protein
MKWLQIYNGYMQRPFPNGHERPFGCNGSGSGYVTAMAVGQRQRLYSGVKMFTGSYLSSPPQILHVGGVELEWRSLMCLHHSRPPCFICVLHHAAPRCPAPCYALYIARFGGKNRGCIKRGCFWPKKDMAKSALEIITTPQNQFWHFPTPYRHKVESGTTCFNAQHFL